MIVIANTMNYNTTAVLALKDDFSVSLSSFENASKITLIHVDNNQWNFDCLCWIERRKVM